MTRFADFDILNAPLSGFNIVEASAGTGKTYSITGLFLRLIVESRLAVDKILVVTFTEAATQELKGRIRERLVQAAAAFGQADATGDHLLDALKERLGEQRPAARQRLIRALRGFDRAAIFTIHGFCHRVLNEHAFDSGLVFETELVTSQDNLKLEIAGDFWRTHIYRASPLFVRYVTNTAKLSPDALANLLTSQVLSPHLMVRPDPDDRSTSASQQQALETAFNKSFEKVARRWEKYRPEIADLFETAEALNRKKYNVKSIPAFIAAMDDYAASPSGNPGLFDKFEKFAANYIATSIKKGHTAVTHPFFDACQQHQNDALALQQLFEARAAALKSAFIQYARHELAVRKKDRDMLYFDDLVFNLHDALTSGTPSAARLAKAARDKYPAALIDEFQDTDTVQYAIFSEIFKSGQDVLFLIGDPKQAIYGFRGADIFAYLQAVRDATQDSRGAYTLTENWRSSPGLVNSVNALFEALPEPFVFPEIGYHQVRPAGKANVPVLTGLDVAGDLEVRVYEPDLFPEISGHNAGKIDDWRRQVADDTAGRVAALVAAGRDGRLLLGDRPLTEADIAVLVRKNTEAEMVQEHLRRYGVPGIILKTGNVFDSHEAFELQVLLKALAAPEDEALVRAALATDMFGWTGADIMRLDDDASLLENRLAGFSGYRDQWQRHGFMAMMVRLIHQEKILPCLMAFADGERRCTNLFQLTELLHKASLSEAAGPVISGLLKWFDTQRHGGGAEQEAYQLRLASDARAVKIITIHKSKGLQFPVVFCPYLWASTPVKKRDVLFHDEANNRALTLDLAPDANDAGEAERAAWEKEQFAEEMRLVYVALTRARNHCCVAMAPEKAGGSALSLLLNGGRQDPEEGRAHLQGLTDNNLIVTRVTPDKGIDPLESRQAEGGTALVCRSFTGDIRRNWRIISFSAMRSAGGLLNEQMTKQMDERYFVRRDVGVHSGGAASAEDIKGIAAFPRGAAAGLCFHELFEHLDFTNRDDTYRAGLVTQKLVRYNFDPLWQEAVCQMVDNVLSARISVADDLTLGSVTNDRRLNEMEFYFPVNMISPDDLKAIYEKTYTRVPGGLVAEEMGKLRFSRAGGYMHGFMDLVFLHQGRYFLLDWKSNFLGPARADYATDRLEAVMQEEYYLLQSHIYTVALDAYLRARLPDYRYDKHFGGSLYVFLRGVDASTNAEYGGADCGIYFEKPSEVFIQALSGKLIGSSD